jgi:RimJ/RimL family protein N-acetyltransferase
MICILGTSSAKEPRVPAFPEATIGTGRLLLTPLGPGDADELVEVLADPRLHRFIGGRPATLQELRTRFRALQGGSPGPEEVWRNWVVRRRADARPVGTVQATIGRRPGGWTAEIAWVVGVPWQGQGYASEAARALVGWLGRHGVHEVVAHIHPDHLDSARVARRAGLRPTGDQADGERVWRRVGHGTAVWSSDAWRRDAVGWLDEQLAANRLRRTGEVTQPHLRPWATVLRAPTTGGTVWLKAAGPETAFEVELYRLLEQVAPERVLSPIAVDPGRGWMVLPDGGTTLGERLDDVDLVEAMVTVLPQYGQLQRDLGPHLGDLLGFGMDDMRAAAMPRRFEEALETVGRYVEGTGDQGDRETLRRVAAMRQEFRAWCRRLDGAAVAASIDHNDLHFWNVLVAVDAGSGSVGRVRFYDWGDSVVAHPFASMLLGLGMLHLQLGVGADDPAVTRPRDAYLEVFGDLASHAELVEELELACRVAKAGRALSRDRALRMRGGGEAGELADAPLHALESLLSDSWITAV